MDNIELENGEGELLLAVYEAALNSEKWPAVLMAICTHIGADQGSLLFFDARNRARNFHAQVCKAKKSKYEQRKITTALEKMDKINKKNFTPQNNPDDQDAYNHTLQFQPIIKLEAKAGTPLLQTEEVTSTLIFQHRGAKAELSPQAFAFLQWLTPHITRAIHIYNHISAIKQHQFCLIESLKNTNSGIILLDGNLHVAFSSPEANRILNHHRALIVQKNDSIEANDKQQDILLQKILKSFYKIGVKETQLQTECISLAFRHPDNIHPLKISILPLSNETQNSIRLALFINDPERPRTIPQEYLQQAYGFTTAEAHIAQLLLNGCNLSEITKLRNTRMETLRGQLKSLMQKSTTHSQAELIRLLMNLSENFFSNTIINH